MPLTRKATRSGAAGNLLLLGVVVLVLALRTFISVRGYLYSDDFAFRYWAATQPFDLSYLSQSYGGHVNPVGLAAQWVLQAVFPGSHTALALFVMTLTTLTLWIAGKTLLLITDRWQAGVLAVMILGLSLFTFENTVWWAAALYAAPYQFFLALGLYFLVRALRGQASSWWVVLAFTGIALSYSRGFLAVLLLFGVAAGLPIAGSERLGIRGALRWSPRLWGSVAFLAMASVALTLWLSKDITRPGFGFASAIRYGWQLLVLNVAPAIWGGPWRWFDVQPDQWHPIVQTPAPPWQMVWVCGLASLAGVILIARFRPTVRGFLPWVLVMAMGAIGVASVARAGSFAVSVAYRYTFDLVWPVMILMVLVAVPLWWQEKSTSHVKRWVWPAAAGFAVSCGFSTLVPAENWMSNEGRAYMANAVAGFGDVPAGYTMLPQGVPNDLIERSLMRNYANSVVVMTPQPGAPTFGAVAQGDLLGFATDGLLQKQDVAGPASIEGPDPECGYQVTDQPRLIPLDGNLIAWPFYARVAYFSGSDTSLNLAIGGQIHTVPIQSKGLRTVYFPVSGPGADVLVSVNTPGTTICVTDIRIGNRVDPTTDEMVPAPLSDNLSR